MKEKIKELFSMLPRTEQLELLRELTSSSEIHNPVVEVVTISQKQYGENVQFRITTEGDPCNPEIKASLVTPWGVFEGMGNNQKIAKAKAAATAIFSISATPINSESEAVS